MNEQQMAQQVAEYEASMAEYEASGIKDEQDAAMGWRWSTSTAAVAGFDLVEPDHSCACGERRMDWLVWRDDETVTCASCSAIFRPGG